MVTENIVIQGRNYLKATGIRNEPGFSARMIKESGLTKILDFEEFECDGEDYMLYCTDSYIKLGEYLSGNGMGKTMFRTLLEAVNDAIRECREVLIEPERLVFDPGFIFVRMGTEDIRFMYSFFDKTDLRKSMRNFFTGILGNYYSGFNIEDERFREWAARQISRADFTAAKMLAAWNYGKESVKPQIAVSTDNETPAAFSFFRNIIGGTSTKKIQENETIPIQGKQDGTYLTGICSIDTKIPVAEEGITIGRQMLKQDYGLFNSGIGKNHARLYMMDGEVYISDLGSRNGTYLNGERIKKQKPEKIVRGDIVSFSDEEFILC